MEGQEGAGRPDVFPADELYGLGSDGFVLYTDLKNSNGRITFRKAIEQ